MGVKEGGKAWAEDLIGAGVVVAESGGKFSDPLTEAAGIGFGDGLLYLLLGDVEQQGHEGWTVGVFPSLTKAKASTEVVI